MYKEDVVHILSKTFFSHKKEQNSAICRDVGGPRDCHKNYVSQKGKNKLLLNTAYMWNLEKQYSWIYSQSKNKDTDVENKLQDTKGGRGVGMNLKIGLDIYVNTTMHKIDN